jgi:hypothetical protein
MEKSMNRAIGTFGPPPREESECPGINREQVAGQTGFVPVLSRMSPSKNAWLRPT